MQWHVDHSRRMFAIEPTRNVRLYSLLHRYGLPNVRNHHALSDAYGTALLLMAIGGGSLSGYRQLDDLLDGRSWSP